MPLTCHSFKRFPRVFWIDATSADTIKQCFKSIGDDQQVNSSGDYESPQAALRWLSTLADPWLLIIDNADHEPNTIEVYLPYGPGANAIITSRNPTIKTLAGSRGHAEVDVLEQEEAVTLLMRSARLDETTDGVREAAKEIVSELHYLALAVDQAGAYIVKSSCTLGEYLQVYKEHSSDLLDDPQLKGVSKYDRAVYATFDVSYDAIVAKTSPKQPMSIASAAKNALQILRIFAFFHHENIMEEIFQRAAITVGEPSLSCHPDDPENKLHRSFSFLPRHLLQLNASQKWDPYQFRDGVRVLLSLSLVKRASSDKTYSLHPLVHAWSRQRIIQDSFEACARSAIAILSYSISGWEQDEDGRVSWQTLTPHVSACHQHVGYDITLYGDVECRNFAFCHAQHANWGLAATFLEAELEKIRRALGPKHILALNCMHRLAVMLINLGKYAVAERLGLLLADDLKKRSGPIDYRTLGAMSRLAHVYRMLGKFDESEVLQLEILDGTRKLGGDNDFRTLLCKQDLGDIYNVQGKFKDAEALLLGVYGAQRKFLRKDHPKILLTEFMLAEAIKGQKRLKEARALYERLLQKCRESHGDEDNHTSLIMLRLATIAKEQGNLSEVCDWTERNLQAEQKLLRGDHPNTLNGMAALGEVYWEMGSHVKGKEMRERCLKGRRRVLGEEHPDTLRSIQIFGEFLWRQDDPAAAQPLLEEALEKRRSVLGRTHRRTLYSALMLGTFYWEKGDYAAAQPLMEEALEIERTLTAKITNLRCTA